MRIAVVGAGVSGLTAAHLLHPRHDVVVYEAQPRIGGHTHTHDIEAAGEQHAIDTGFIVFNDWTYPLFIRLIERLGVAWQPSDMSFSVRCERTGLEYAGSSLNTLYAQRRNLLRPSFHRLLLDILRFYRDAKSLLRSGRGLDQPLGAFVRSRGYSAQFYEQHLVPMSAAIWSAGPRRLADFPIGFMARFFNHHGMLNVLRRPRWRVIRGGSRAYLAPLTKGFAARIRVGDPVRGVRRHHDHVQVDSATASERYDQVILAAHSDEALALLQDPSSAERAVLGAIPYQANDAVLHTDVQLLPRARRAWASWNYLIPAGDHPVASVTYNMNMLQGLRSAQTYCVTLNRGDAIDPQRVLRRITYHHPVFDRPAVAAQQRWHEVSGVDRRTHYCGAYWGFGFHEDGVRSAVRVAEALGCPF